MPQSARKPTLEALKKEIRACQVCAQHLPLGPRPIIQISQSAKVLIIGQAPGAKVHDSGVPWDDTSGDRLREWLGVSKVDFYGEDFAIVPMGFCTLAVRFLSAEPK